METTRERFQADVIDASMTQPVLVDFWAPWCAPCKTLGPMLERLEAQYGGRFKLVKVNTDAEQTLAQTFRIRSIPTVFAIVGGRPVDQFQGALPEAQLREFIDRLMPNPAETELDQADAALQRGDAAAATEHVKKALLLDANNDAARLMYAQLLLHQGDPFAARSQIEALSVNALADPQVQALAAQIKAQVEANRPPPRPDLEGRIERNSADLDARFELAEHFIEYKHWEPALAQLLEIVRRDRTFRDDGARKRMIEVFELAQAQPQLVSEWRRKLSSVLF
ncbi:MAG TPA: thioredoxin [Burkholderiaceae bacterium]|nr:thioredoxin [Burkholderiaceae bacterium]